MSDPDDPTGLARRHEQEERDAAEGIASPADGAEAEAEHIKDQGEPLGDNFA